ncbi:MAG: amidase [Acidimicrobiales bacterium]
MDFRETSLRDLAAQVQAGERSARDLVDHALERIESLNPAVNAFCSVDGDRAMADAAALDARRAGGENVGPLAGIPIGVKDLEDATGFVTTFGSALHRDDAPATTDSTLVARLKAAGCIVVGKTNTPEHGFKGVTDNPTFGSTANPLDLDRSPGGSSGGSAAAIASGMVPLATGSDGGGSIRIPSALCGLTGMKTSQGRVPLGGARPPGSGLLSVKGPMAMRARDVALALDACVGPDPTDIHSYPGLHDPWSPQLDDAPVPDRIAYSPTLGFATVDSEVAAAVEQAVRRLERAGSEVVEVPSVFDEDPTRPWIHMWTALRARAQGHLVDTPQWESIDPALREQIRYGLTLTAVDLALAIDESHLLNRRLEERAFSHAPVLICPTVAGHAPVLGDHGTVDGEPTPGWVAFTPFVNLTRNPAGSVTCGHTSGGLPIGLQVIGRQREDLTVLQTLAACERELGSGRPPAAV